MGYWIKKSDEEMTDIYNNPVEVNKEKKHFAMIYHDMKEEISKLTAENIQSKKRIKN